MRSRRARPLAILALLSLAALAAPLSAGCGNSSSSSSTGTAAETLPARATFEVVVLDDHANPFETLPPPIPAGIASFQEMVVFGPESFDTRTFVRIVIQPGETLPQAMARAKPWLDARPLPPGDRFVFSEIIEENETTKKREA